MPKVVCIGMALVDVLVEGVHGYPPPGETGLVKNISFSTGGDAINEAVTLAKLGVDVGLFSVVGKDQQGSFIVSECRKFGIDTSGIALDPVRSTSTSIVLIGAGGERSFLSHREGTVNWYGPEHVHLDLLRPGLQILSVGSLFQAPRLDREVLPGLLAKAKEIGATTIADLIVEHGAGSLEERRELLRHLDFICPSQQEAEYYTGYPDPVDAAKAFRDYGVRNVVVKLGSDGAMAITADAMVKVPALPTRVVDTTGAGDNFMAGFIYGLSQGKDLSEALQFGSATAGLSVQAVGATAGVQSLAQVEAYLGHFLASSQSGRLSEES